MSPGEIDILLVEDQPTDAELVLRALWQQVPRERVAWVRDGEKALQRLVDLQSAPACALPRLVLLDLKLPRVSGLEVATRIRADAALSHVPVVFLSSSADDNDIARAVRCGANSYIVKPVDTDELERTVVELARYWTVTNRTTPG
jgi:two-component system, response regulator